jgi:hypothetical protein
MLVGRRADLEISLDANITGLFNWNVKQVFLYVQADVHTAHGRHFRAVVWDKVVNRTDDKVVSLYNQPAKYPLISVSDSRGGLWRIAHLVVAAVSERWLGRRPRRSVRGVGHHAGVRGAQKSARSDE